MLSISLAAIMATFMTMFQTPQPVPPTLGIPKGEVPANVRPINTEPKPSPLSPLFLRNRFR